MTEKKVKKKLILCLPELWNDSMLKDETKKKNLFKSG
jgi:hypothetical protein